MNPEVGFRQNLKVTMEASTSQEDGMFAKELEEELMKCTTIYEEKKVGNCLVDQTEKIHKNNGMKVNVMEYSKPGGNDPLEAEHSDATECSSSFDGSDDYGANRVEALGNSEALSSFHDDAESDFNFSESRKLVTDRKRLSSHWRSFVHPIMWRCKWIELQIKKLEARAKKYDRKLEEYNRKATLEGTGVESLTFPQNNVRNQVFRRKKRRRAEAKNDIAAYMSQHNLFSYYENRKFINEAACHVLKNHDAVREEVAADYESWDSDEQQCVETGNDDNNLEHLLLKIEHLHSRVVEMKTRVGNITREYAGKFSCTDLAVACDAPVSSPPSTGYRMPMGTYIASQLMSDYNLGGLLLPESTVTNHREFVSNANASSSRFHLPYPFGHEEDEVLIDNLRVREEMRYFEEVKIHSVPDKPDLLVKGNQPPPKISTVSNHTNALRGRRKGVGQ